MTSERSGPFALVEHAPAANRDRHGPKVGWRHDSELGQTLLNRLTRKVVWPQRVEAGQGQGVHGRCGFDARQRGDGRDQLIEERAALLGRRVSVARQHELGGHDVARLETEGSILQASEAPDEQPRPDEQQHRQRNLRGDDDVPPQP